MAKTTKYYRIEYPIHGGRQNKILIAGGISKKKALKNAKKKMVPEMDPEGAMTVTRVKGPILHSEITPFNGVHMREDTIRTEGGNPNA